MEKNTMYLLAALAAVIIAGIVFLGISTPVTGQAISENTNAITTGTCGNAGCSPETCKANGCQDCGCGCSGNPGTCGKEGCNPETCLASGCTNCGCGCK